MTKCAYLGCGQDFAPHDARQLYCSPEHSQLARDARKRLCKNRNCRAKLNTADRSTRFCSNACRWSYLEQRKQSQKHVVRLPIAVLLPSGCSPRRVYGTQEPLGSTIGTTGMVGYGEIARKVFCAHYERCLSWVVSKNWGNWDCRDCKVEQPKVPALQSKRSNYE